MTLLMRDSINASAIPLQGLSAVAGYGDGRWTWSSADWARFPAPIVSLSIVILAQDAGDILDVEIGDATPADCPGWADRFRRPGRRLPTIYCNRETIAAVRQAMGARPFDWWAATLDGTQDVPGAVAVQYAGSAQTGANYDESIIFDPGWIGGSMADGFTDADRQLLSRLETDFFDGAQSFTPDGKTPVPSDWPNFVPAALAQIQTVVLKLQQPTIDVDALASAIVAKLPTTALTAQEVTDACKVALRSATFQVS